MTHCNGLKLETGKKMMLGIDIGSTTAKLVLVKDGAVSGSAGLMGAYGPDGKSA